MTAYCKVSTDQLDQLASYEAQIAYYTAFINNYPDYEMAGIYADEGTSGTNTKKCEQFNKMIEKYKAGKIDKIITKFISRFALNTLDTLNFVRGLKELRILELRCRFLILVFYILSDLGFYVSYRLKYFIRSFGYINYLQCILVAITFYIS